MDTHATTMRIFTLLILLSLSALAADRKPNIIFVLADDMGYGELGCFGQKLIATPNIDRMAAEGIKFTRFYAGAPVCAPSRSVLMLALRPLPLTCACSVPTSRAARPPAN